jgi:GNAT superfamily N-acetyltransferase
MTIRPAISTDAPSIARIQVDCWRQAYVNILDRKFLLDMSVEEKEAFWRHAIGNSAFGEVSVAMVGSEVIGFTSYGPARMDAGADREVYTLYVATDQQRRGVGAQLIKAAESPGLTMEARTAEGNPFATFYQGLGATLVRRDTVLIGGKNYPLVCYQWQAK